jgi:hypothetical protein
MCEIPHDQRAMKADAAFRKPSLVGEVARMNVADLKRVNFPPMRVKRDTIKPMRITRE